jgi:putative ribosome biogenesis GTPase RsgA
LKIQASATEQVILSITANTALQRRAFAENVDVLLVFSPGIPPKLSNNQLKYSNRL